MAASWTLSNVIAEFSSFLVSLSAGGVEAAVLDAVVADFDAVVPDFDAVVPDFDAVVPDFEVVVA